MIQDIFPKQFQVDFKQKRPEGNDRVFVFCGHIKREQKILLRDRADGILEIPSVDQVVAAGVVEEKLQYLFAITNEAGLDENYFMLMEFDNEDQAFRMDGFSYEPVRSFRRCLPKDLCFAGMTAYQLYDWYRINQYCGCCGSKTVPFEKERAVRCPKCGNLIFPKICPAVIAGVIDPYFDQDGHRIKEKDRIVVTRYAGRAYTGVALIAGFCEIGETPEDTLRREVMEEVGLRVKNIRYYKSQPWGFDSNLLLGYYAEVDGDKTIVRDTNELAVAEWAERSSLKNTEENILALTGTMIDAFIRGQEE